MRLLLFSFLSILLFSYCTNPSADQNTAEPNQALIDSLNQALDKIHTKGLFKGFSVAISDDKGTLYCKGYGLANVAEQKAYTDQTIQNIASISKTFIGIALLKAQEMELLKLDDPINQYLPFEVVNPHFPEAVITIRQLTNHTSGITDSDFYDKSYVLQTADPDTSIFEVDEDFNPPALKMPMGAFLEAYLTPEGDYYSPENFLAKQAGERFDYSNVAATLAAHVLEVVAEESFAVFTKKHILEPLGMNDSGWNFEQVDMSTHTTQYASSGKSYPVYQLNTYPDGGLRASARDMAKYLTELIKAKNGQGSLLSPVSYTEYFKASLADEVFEEGRPDAGAFNDEYDMGVFMGINGLGGFGHSGGDPGTASLMFFNPATERGAYMIVNTDVYNQEGGEAFYGIMSTLKDFENKFSQ